MPSARTNRKKQQRGKKKNNNNKQTNAYSADDDDEVLSLYSLVTSVLMMNKNKKGHQPSSDAILESLSSLAFKSSSSCYHGSSAEKFSLSNRNNYFHSIFEYLILTSDIDYNAIGKFGFENQELANDKQFAQFIFAWCTELYLKRSNEEDNNNNSLAGDDIVFHEFLQTLLQFAINIIHYNLPLAENKLSIIDIFMVDYDGMCHKGHCISAKNYDNFCKISTKSLKYRRDVRDDYRGIINSLARETLPYCDCMKHKKEESKLMEKIGRCYGCDEQFSKQKLFACKGCTLAKYHSRECQIMDWPKHKYQCNIHRDNKINADTANNERYCCREGVRSGRRQKKVGYTKINRQ